MSDEEPLSPPSADGQSDSSISLDLSTTPVQSSRESAPYSSYSAYVQQHGPPDLDSSTRWKRAIERCKIIGILCLCICLPFLLGLVVGTKWAGASTSCPVSQPCTRELIRALQVLQQQVCPSYLNFTIPVV